MGLSPRRIRQRIRSVKNTKKITKAMELVAASKMRRATAAVSGTRPFSTRAWEMVQAVSSVSDLSAHPLLQSPKDAARSLLVLFTSDRGLCGGFNARVLKEAVAWCESHVGATDVIAVGRRGEQLAHRLRIPVVASFTQLSNHPTFTDVLPVVRLILDEFHRGKYKEVVVAYTDFVSALTQRPKLFTLLPLAPAPVKDLGETSATLVSSVSSVSSEYAFEPSPRLVLDRLLPRIIEVMTWQALLESSASEHSARMMAMRSASDASSDMIDDLTLTFNQARQANITREIAEISAGKAAIE